MRHLLGTAFGLISMVLTAQARANHHGAPPVRFTQSVHASVGAGPFRTGPTFTRTAGFSTVRTAGFSTVRSFGRTNLKWSSTRFFPRYGCKGYFCPTARCWYYWCAPYSCYLPFSYFNQFPPTMVNPLAGIPGGPAMANLP